jgi:hypothetical protein
VVSQKIHFFGMFQSVGCVVPDASKDLSAFSIVGSTLLITHCNVPAELDF